MKIANFGDLHGHLFKEFDKAGGETGSLRLDRIVLTLRYMKNWCKENHINWVLCSGDMFHARGKVDTLVFNSIYDEIESFYENHIQMIIIAGNHDQRSNADVPENSLHAFKNLRGVHVFDTVGSMEIMDAAMEDHSFTDDFAKQVEDTKIDLVEIVVAPYSKNAQMVKDYIASVEKKAHPQILLFHLGISGGFVGSGSYPMADAFDVEDLRPDLFKYVIGGHFHTAQFLGGYPHVFYCGSPIEHSFGDEGEDHGFFVVDTDKRWDVQFVPIPNPKFRTVYGKDLDVSLLQKYKENGDYIRFILTADELSSFEHLIPEGLSYKVELQKEYAERSRSVVKVGMSFEEIVSKYAEENNPGAKQTGLDILAEAQQK